jgi:signal recognition particle receptor subunit beta
MAFINLKRKEIKIKIVYYGPGQSGKTTNLLYVYGKFRNQIKSKMVSIDTLGDQTIFFDFLPFYLGKLNGFNIIVQLYTVPGQVRYRATRELVLRGADGIVFVADMLKTKREENVISLKDLHYNLMKYNKRIFDIPLVFQFNKLDLVKKNKPLLSAKRLDKDLNSILKRPYFTASALKGYNVASTLKQITSMTISSLRKN